MEFIIGEQFHGDVGQLECRLLGSVEAGNEEEARQLAVKRWPRLELCFHGIDSNPQPSRQTSVAVSR
jgi:hypothetical protein